MSLEKNLNSNNKCKSIAIISYFTFIGLLFSFFVNQQKKLTFVAFHIRQMLGLTILQFINGYLIVKISNILSSIIGLVIFVFIIIGIISAFQGKMTETPFIGKYFQIWFKNIIKGDVETNDGKCINSSKKIISTIIGAILGLPLSYYFQPEIVRAKIGGISGYIKHFDEIFKEKDLFGNVVVGVIVFAVIGFVIGYFMDKSESKTNN